MSPLSARIFNGTAISIAGRIVGTIVSILTVGIITRALIERFGQSQGVAAFGVYSAVLAYLSVVAIFADGGLYLYFTREASKEGADEKNILENIWQMRLFSVATAMVLGMAVIVFLPYDSAVKTGVSIGIFGTGFQILSQLLMGVFQKHLRLAPPALAEVLGRFVQFGGVYLAAKYYATVNGFLVFFVLGTFATFIWNVAAAHKIINFRLIKKLKSEDGKKIFHGTLPLAAMLILSVIFFKIDSVLLSLLRSPQDLAYYALPYKILESLLFFPAVMGGMLLPIFSKASSREARGVNETLRSSFGMYVICAVPLCVGLYLFAPFAIGLLGGPTYGPSVPALRILTLSLGVLFFGNLFGNTLIAIGRQKVLVYIYAFLVVVNVGLNLIIIPRYSFIGAAWVTLITETMSVFFAYWALHIYGIRLFSVFSRSLR